MNLEHSPAFREAKLLQGFDSTLAKPFRKDELAGLLATMRRLAAT